MSLLHARQLATLVVLALALSPDAGGTQSVATARFVEQYAREHDFSGSVLIQQRGRITLERSFGLADRAFRIPNTARTRFKIASITKTFTAVLVLQLVEEGRIDLQQPIMRYLPEYRGPGADRITVHQLLNHTSGLVNFDQVKSAEDAIQHGMPQYQLPQTADQLLTRAAGATLANAPGTVFDYNNGDYLLLGRLVEVQRGQSFADVLRARILQPLGMRNSGILVQSDIVDSLAMTYFVRPGGTALSNDLPVYPEHWGAAGAMYSTPRDVATFADALFGGRLLKASSLALMMRPGLDDYGYGAWSYTAKFGDRTWHVFKRPGQIMGAQSQLYHIVEPDITIILLANTASADLDEFVARIGREVARESARPR